MGEAMERHYGGHLCYGPPIEEGYYYDMFLDGRLACFYNYLLKLDSLFSFLILVFFIPKIGPVSVRGIYSFGIFDIDQSLS